MFKYAFLLVSIAFITISCDPEEAVIPPPPKPVEAILSAEIANKWVSAELEFIKSQPSNTPVYISRCLGYLGVAMYESVVPGSIVYKSIAPQLNELGEMPKPIGKIDYDLALNESQNTLVRKFWQHSYYLFTDKTDSLYKKIIADKKLIITDTMIVYNSRKFGEQVAKKIYEWSKTDGGELAYLKNFDPNYKLPSGLGYWQAPVNGQVSSPYPLQPEWGKNRTLLKVNATIPIPEMEKYSIDRNSAYYKDFEEIFNITNKLTQEQKEIAIWWADDPSETAAPAGHSYALARQLLIQQKKGLFETALTYAKVGISVADAFTCCWKVKFTYHSERPANYIRRNIMANFVQFWPEPPFPAFPSGHATQISAAATAMISVFGNDVIFTDNTYLGRTKDSFRNVDFKPRSYMNIWQAAEECGESRLYGGIHIRQDNTGGLNLGKTVGENVSKIAWKY